MITIDFKRLNGLPDISKSFSVPIEYLESVISTPENYYKKLCIPKKGKSKEQYRIVYKADERLSHLQSEILIHIEHKIYHKENKFKANENYITKYAYGFIKNKGTLQNAKIHLNKKYLINLDIKNFFKSISINDVYHVFIKLGTPPEGAKILAKISTYHEKLEEGLHTSPIISNLHCYQLDIELAKLGKSNQCAYSRYADDITFSGNFRTPKQNLIEKILKKYNFSINEEKTRFSKKGTAQYVTGLSVSDDKCPRIPRPIKRQLRMELYYIKKYGFKSHCDQKGINDRNMEWNRINGWINYISGIETELGEKYSLSLGEIYEN
jgi:RNA-directed DNA polymerase